jgi:glycine cleavage system aminomethyltransferase T
VATPRETPVGEASPDTASGGSGGTDTRDRARIEADIEQTRQELGETVEALSAKLDVKARARQRLVLTKEHAGQRADAARRRAAELAVQAKVAATENHEESRTVVPAGAVIVVVALSAAVVWKRRDRR